MTKRLKTLIFILAAGMILSACSGNTETPQPTQAPAPTTAPAATQAEMPTATPVDEPGQGYPSPTQVSGQGVPTGYPAPTGEVPALNNVGYPAPGTFNLIMADGSERAVSVDVLNTLPKVKVSINGAEMEVLGIMDALKKYDVETVNQITADGANNSTLNLAGDQISKSYLDIQVNGTIRVVVQGLEENAWVVGLTTLKVQ